MGVACKTTSVQEGREWVGQVCVMRRSPPANYATPSVCARGLHMPPPAKARVSSRSEKRCQENEVDVGQDVQGLGGAARRRRRPVGRLPATRAARRAKTPAKKPEKSVSKRRASVTLGLQEERCPALRSTQRGGYEGRQSRCLHAHRAGAARRSRPTRCAPWCKILCISG